MPERLKSLLNEKSWPMAELWLVTLTANSILTIDFIYSQWTDCLMAVVVVASLASSNAVL